jgi:hypothetical protein
MTQLKWWTVVGGVGGIVDLHDVDVDWPAYLLRVCGSACFQFCDLCGPLPRFVAYYIVLKNLEG